MRRTVLALLVLASLTFATPAQASTYTFRGIYGPGPYSDQVAAGFSILDAGPFVSTLNSVQALGAKAWIWLGGYSNTTCTFNNTDAWVTSHVNDIVGHPAIAAYFIDDEPNSALCPTAPAQMKQRSDLVKTIDNTHPTFIATYKTEQFAAFAGKVDVLALDHYPCAKSGNQVKPCQFSFIDQEAAVADSLGVRYWIVIQAHGDSFYRVPSPGELHTEFVHARATHMEGFIVFAWQWPASDPSLWLANNPALIAQLQVENAA